MLTNKTFKLFLTTSELQKYSDVNKDWTPKAKAKAKD